MKQLILISLIILGNNFTTSACCAEYNERYVPLGQVNEELYILEVKFHRNCRGMGSSGQSNENQFYISGIVNILKYKDDAFTLADSLLEFQEIECYCTSMNFKEKTKIDSLLNSYYRIALVKLEKRRSFERAVQKSITFNDSTNYTLTTTDTASWLHYNTDYNQVYPENGINIWENISTQEPHLIAEKRIYSTNSFNIEIIQLSSEFIKEDTQESIKESFNTNIQFWAHNNLWHGIRRDVVYLSNE